MENNPFVLALNMTFEELRQDMRHAIESGFYTHYLIVLHEPSKQIAACFYWVDMV